jgi:hypothetical protein
MTHQREQHLLAEIDRLRAENELLRQRVDQILRQLFGAKSEALDPSQLDLFTYPEAAEKTVAADGTETPPAAEALLPPPPVKKRSPRKPCDNSHLEVRETLVIHPAVQPIQAIHAGLLANTNLQADETPIRYQNPGKGKCSTGYLWVIHAPRNGIKGDILYQWHPSRKAACLDDLLPSYQGYLQTAAYAAYDSWIAGKDGIILVACWAHARRKFHEAFKSGQTLAAGPLAAIARIYQIETTLRKTHAESAERSQVRQARSAPLLQILKADLVTLRARPEVLPKSALGKAIDYTLTLWAKLTLYVDQGQLEIDNNWIENGIRPTAIGKKNWLFIGGEATGQRSAIIYTLIECARRHGHNPEAYLTDILERLPAMTNQDDLTQLLPSRWRAAAATDPAPEPAHSV